MNPRILLVAAWLSCAWASAGVLGNVRGIVHDPSHRPVQGAKVTLKASASDFTKDTETNSEGQFEFGAIPAGAYVVKVAGAGFSLAEQQIAVMSGSAPILHFQLKLSAVRETVEVSETSEAENSGSSTPTTLVDRREIEKTPGASLSNSLSMITNFVPGAYMVHDQLHVRGGHQVTWAIDGIPVPNTNIASNVGPQIDPKDIDYLEAQRGSYSPEYGDRTYGVFNVVPRTGFERNNEAELFTTLGSFYQTNDQLNFGSHTEKFAYFASVNGNRSDYGLPTPGPDLIHDRVVGFGGFGTLLYNMDQRNQLRLVTSLRRDDYQIPNDPDAQSNGIRDLERERDALVNLTWIHTYSPGVIQTISPFYHFNRADFDGGPNDTPVTTTQHRGSTYEGAQASVSVVNGPHNARVGIYGFAQQDTELARIIANDGSGASVLARQSSNGNLAALFLDDQYKLTSWLTLNAGLRATHFSGAISENALSPRVGAAIRIPRLGWALRGFYGRFYQAPPLSTLSGPLAEFAVTQGLGFLPLKGERDEENQFGLTIPLRGWSFDVDTFHTRARNFFDHNAIGNSNVFFPLTIAGAKLYGWEVSVRSPRLLRRGQMYMTYSFQHALAEGAVSGGLTDFSPPEQGYFLLDHDQRHTLHTGGNIDLPARTWLAGDVYYGSGFVDGSSDVPAHLPGHTTFDLTLGKSIGERWSVAVTALNAANRRFLLDNSTTFNGTHYADPRQIYVQLRYRFHY